MATRRRLLIVDDDAPIREMLARVIARSDVEVETARDGVEAIERITHNGYDVILLDLMMPKLDGWAVLDHMRRTQPHKLRRTILASAVPDVEVRRRLESPVFQVHTKPFDIRALVSDIDACIAANRTHPQSDAQDQPRLPY